MITVTFSDFTEETYDSLHDAQDAILEALAEGVLVEHVEDSNGNPYSCVFTVMLQEER